MTCVPFLDTRTPRKSCLYPIYIRITDGNFQKLIPVGFKINPDHWAKNAVKKNHPQSTIINAKITDIISDIHQKSAEAQITGKPFRPELIGTGKTSHSFIDFIMKRAEDYEKRDMPVMNKKLYRMSKELRALFPDLTFADVSPELVRNLDGFLIEQGNTANTRYKKIKMYGEFYEQAGKEGKHDGRGNPFKDYKIKTTKPHKEKLTKQELKKLEDAELIGAADLARDIFLFSYYCKGQRFGDCLLSKRSDIRNGRVYFTQGKTDKAVSVLIHDRLQAIIDKYEPLIVSKINGKEQGYVFPYVKVEPRTKSEKLSIVGTFNTIVNRNLKLVAALCGIDKTLTMHIARHTFASHLRDVTDSIHAIKEALGHTHYRTTEEYLNSLDEKITDVEVGKLYNP